MTFNRLIDSKIDALTPRTSMRSIPAGKITAAQALLFTVLSFALMLFAASHLPPLCLALSPIAVFWLSFYSYTKRFTWLCHLVLGIALGGGALGGWIAAGGQLNEVAPWVLALAVFSWVSGCRF
jgi:4-hydroxybenzoate polyprenyltransferase